MQVCLPNCVLGIICHIFKVEGHSLICLKTGFISKQNHISAFSGASEIFHVPVKNL